ncbi:MAG: PAS domain S-box protein, partial [Kordiimonadaceae bacterium]|nr:PAS domain S-box protein [Kordiimonadaceae bacterium]
FFLNKTNLNENNLILDALNKSQATISFNTNGTILDANDNFLNTLGYDLAEVKGQHHSMFVEPTYRESSEYTQFWEALNRGEFKSEEFMRLAKGGKEVWIQATYNPVIDANGKVLKIIKFATDITEQKNENASNQGQIEAIDKAQAVISFELDGTIIEANDNFLGAVGYSLKEIQGKHHSIFVESQLKESSEYKEFWAALARGEYQAAEYKRIGKNGNEIWIQASYNPIFDPEGKPFKVVKFATDITEQVNKRHESQRVGKMVDENLDKILTAVGGANQQSSGAAAASTQTLQTVQTVAAAVEEFEISSQEIAKSMTTARTEVSRV